MSNSSCGLSRADLSKAFAGENMDLDLGMISAVVHGGTLVYSDMKKKGINSKSFRGDKHVLAWEFIEQNIVEVGHTPSVDYFQSKAGFQLIQPEDDVRVYAEEIRKRGLWGKLTEGHEKVGNLLEERKADEALIELDKVSIEARKMSVLDSPVESILAMGNEVIDYYNRLKRGERGILTPWEGINDATLGYWPGDFIVFAARMGVGKCVDGDTELPDPKTGIYRSIRDVVKDKGDVLTREKYGNYFPVSPSLHISTGRKECLKVVTRGGLDIVATPEHPFSIVGGWSRADELKVGDRVETVKRMPEPFECKDDFKEEHLLLLSALLAEGGLTTDPPKFSNDDVNIVDIVSDCAESVGAILIKHKGMNSSTWALVEEDVLKRRTKKPNPVRVLLNELGVGYEKSINKKIPDFIFGLSNRLLAKFIGMFWSCDGSVYSNKISIGLGSEKIVRQLKRLLLRFGITGRIRYKSITRKSDGKVFHSWSFLVHASCISLFKKSIPLYGEKVARLCLLNDGCNSNVDNVPMNKWLKDKINKIIDIGVNKGLMVSMIGAELGWSSYFSRRNLFQYGTISKRILKAIAKVFDAPELLSLCDPFWDEIVSVEPIGEREVYDLTVPNTHCFVANDIVAHNTFAMLMMARHAWMNGKKVLFIGTEMARLKLAIRFYAIHLKLPYKEFRRGQLGEYQENALMEGIKNSLNEEGLDIVGDNFNSNMSEIESAVDLVEPDIAFIDGIYLVKNRGKDRHTMVSNTADDIKRLARSRNIPFVASHQFNRTAGANDKASISAENIGITDVIGWNADVMYGLWQTDDMKDDSLMGFKPLKMREGEGREFMSKWEFGEMVFDQVDDRGDKYNDNDYDNPVGDDYDGGGDDDDNGGFKDKGSEDFLF